jgi:hypothetical protein
MQKKQKLSSEEKKARRKAIELENEKAVLDTWQKNSDLGKKKYALRFGAFTWGIPTFLIYSAIMIVFNFFIKEGVRYDLFQAAFALVFFFIFGTVYGMVLWNKNEKLYRKKFPYGKRT